MVYEKLMVDWKLMVWCVMQAMAITIAGAVILLGIAEMARLLML